MLVVYGKLHRILSKVYSEAELSPLEGAEILDAIELGELREMSSFVMSGADFAAVGASGHRVRSVVEQVGVPVVIITESMSWVESKKPTNPLVTVLEEKSKKPEILKSLLDKYARMNVAMLEPSVETPAPVMGAETLQKSEVPAISDDDEGVGESLVTRVLAREAEEAQTEETKRGVKSTNSYQAEKVAENARVSESPTAGSIETKTEHLMDLPPRVPEMIVREVRVDHTVEIDRPLFDYKIKQLPKYASLALKGPEDVISHLRQKWGLNGVV